MKESPEQEYYTVTVSPEQEGMRLDKYLAVQLPALSRSRIQALIAGNQVVSDGEVITQSSAAVKSEQQLTVTIPPVTPTIMQPAAIPLTVAFEDEHMLVINKQAGLTVHPGAGCYQDTMANALIAHCGDSLSGIGGVSRPGIVHRLDKDTSGLLVVAKNDHAHHHLSEQIASRTLKRIYTAIIWGTVTPPSGTISNLIARSQKDRVKMAIVKTGGKEAVTHYRTEEVFGEGIASLVSCKLQTGRTHQIRLHFSNLHHPLIGDPVYGSSKPAQLKNASAGVQEYLQGFKRQALHSHKIGFFHPYSNEYLEFTAPVPEDMEQLIALLRMQSA
jgi:23S rRNA pseudouridine1911/1915/1917 synthase